MDSYVQNCWLMLLPKELQRIIMWRLSLYVIIR